MGYIKHHAIVVTSVCEEDIKKAHEKAKKIFPTLVSEIITTAVNYYNSFFISPDGSKEGWQTSNEGDVSREKFIEWIEIHNNIRGGKFLEYVEFFYGEDNGKSEIVNHN